MGGRLTAHSVIVVRRGMSNVEIFLITGGTGRIPSMHDEGEEIVRATGIPTTVIRPRIFAQHFLGLSPALFRCGDDAFHLPTGDARVAPLS